MAAFDFPANPTAGDIYNPTPGVSYRWDGTKWVINAQAAIDGIIPEAPIDGQQYARKDGAWDIVAVAGSIDDLSDVDTTTSPPSIGLGFVWDGVNWVPATVASTEEAPQDGDYYIRRDGTWITLVAALDAINGRTIDGGDITTNTSAGDGTTIDGGVAV